MCIRDRLISDNDINECRPLMINYCNLRVNSNELFENENSWEEKMNKILYQDGEFSYQDREKNNTNNKQK